MRRFRAYRPYRKYGRRRFFKRPVYRRWKPPVKKFKSKAKGTPVYSASRIKAMLQKAIGRGQNIFQTPTPQKPVIINLVNKGQQDLEVKE